MRLSPRLWLVVLTGLTALSTHADIFRWTDAQGVIHYTDKAPDKDARPATLPPLQSYSPAPSAPVSPVSSSGESDTTGTAAAAMVRVSSPQADETIRDAEGKISVVLAVELQPGQGLVYFLDGKAQNPEPTPSTGFLLVGVERGEHQLSAAIVDADGRELARSSQVTVFMMPSVIRRR